MDDDEHGLLFAIMNAIAGIDLEDIEVFDEQCQEESLTIERGRACKDNLKRKEIQDKLCERQKNKTLQNRLDDLKTSILSRDRKTGLKIMALLMNDYLEQSEKDIFIRQFSDSGRELENPEYIPCISTYAPIISNTISNTVYCLDEENRENFSDIPSFSPTTSSKQLDAECNYVKSPIETQYNRSEAYLLHKGIDYCRIQLKMSNEKSENAVLKELKSMNVLQTVFTEKMRNKNNYIKMLAESYPDSFTEIKFLIQEDRDLILRSSIFVNLAQKDISHLILFIKQMSKLTHDTTISQACQQSRDDAISVASLLSQKHPPEMQSNIEYIKRFFDRHRPSKTFNSRQNGI